MPLLTVKITLIPDKGFQNTEILYQAVIAQSVEPRQIFVSISITSVFVLRLLSHQQLQLRPYGDGTMA